MSGYNHTQRGIIGPLQLVMSAVFLVGAWFNRAGPALPGMLLGAAMGVFLTFGFWTLTARDEGERLAVRFGPVPVFRTSIPYSTVVAVERVGAGPILCWGIHWTRRGWMWNVGGSRCVRIVTRKGAMMIGTDDPDGLSRFLEFKIQPRPGTGAER